MTNFENEKLVRIATALGYKVQGISPAYYGTDFGRLELLDEKTGHEFPWNPITHAGDRYALIKKLGMKVDFSKERGEARLRISSAIEWNMSFPKDDDAAEAEAILRLAHDWAQGKLHGVLPEEAAA